MKDNKITRRADKSIEELATFLNPIIRGVINYFKNYYKSELYKIFNYMDRTLTKWATRKYKVLKGRQKEATQFIKRIKTKQPNMFVHWEFQIR